MDMTPAVLAADRMEDIGVNSLDTIATLVENATGLDPAQKQALLAKVSAEREKLLTLHKEITGLLESYGDIDWKTLANDAYEMYKKLRDEK
jgi:hypothetical protein